MWKLLFCRPCFCWEPSFLYGMCVACRQVAIQQCLTDLLPLQNVPLEGSKLCVCERSITNQNARHTTVHVLLFKGCRVATASVSCTAIHAQVLPM